MTCARCVELETELAKALSVDETEELVSADEITKLKKAVRSAQAKAREAEKKSEEAMEASKAHRAEITVWRRMLPEIEVHCDDTGKTIIEQMYNRYSEFMIG